MPKRENATGPQASDGAAPTSRTPDAGVQPEARVTLVGTGAAAPAQLGGQHVRIKDRDRNDPRNA